MTNLPNINYQELLQQLRMQREQIEEAILVIERLARGTEGPSRSGKPPAWLTKSTNAGGSASPAPAKKKRGLSAAGRKAISDAAKRRWAAKKSGQGGAAKTAGTKGKKAGKKRG